MKRISIIGLCLMAAMAVSAVSVASSSAASLPEFSSTGGFPVTFTSTNALPLLPTLHSSILESVVNCEMTKDSGEIASATTVAKIKVLYTGCKEGTSSNTCTSTGEPTGAIITKELKGRIGYIGGHLAEKLVGTELEPASGTVFAEFVCTGVAKTTIVEGCTIGEAKQINVRSTTGSLLFWENAGLNGQLYTLIDEKTEKTRHPCEQSVTATVLKVKGKGWLMDDELETFSKEVDLEA